MKIYVIEVGCYSDREIVTATTSKERAEQIKHEIQSLNQEKEVNIFTFEDGEIVNDRGFVVTFDLNYHYINVFSEGVFEIEYLSHYTKINEVHTEFNKNTFDDFFYVKVQADTKEQAKKIACDIIAAYQYNRQGV